MIRFGSSFLENNGLGQAHPVNSALAQNLLTIFRLVKCRSMSRAATPVKQRGLRVDPRILGHKRGQTLMRRDPLKAAVTGFAFVLFAVIALWLYSRYSEIRTGVAEQKAGETAALVNVRVASLEVHEVFTGPASLRQRQIFESVFGAMPPSEAVGIKVRDRNLAVLWSNLGDSVDEHFAGGRELQEALNGEVGFAIATPKAQSFSQRSYDELSATYVPVADRMGRIVGVVEVYQPTLLLRGEISGQFRRMVLPLGLFMFVGCGVLVFLLRMLMTPKLSNVDAKPVLSYSPESPPLPSPQSR